MQTTSSGRRHSEAQSPERLTLSEFLQRYRYTTRFIALFILGILGSIAFYILFSSTSPVNKLEPSSLLLILLMVALFPAIFFSYLGSSSIGRSREVSDRIDEITIALQAREASIARALKSIHLDDEDKKRLVAEAKAAILESAKEDALREIKASIQRDESERYLLDALRSISRRLEQEIEALRRRSNVNLFIGISLGIAGLVLLGFVAFREVLPQTDSKSFLISSIPRLSLGILIEFLAYFFLRLYKAAATEIRYFHNELTNQEARAVALMAARKHPNDQPLVQALTAFLQTERNFVLSKDQSTVSLEHRKLEIAESQALVGTLEGLLSKAMAGNDLRKDQPPPK